MKDLGRKVFGGIAVANPPGDVGVDALEVQLVEFAEAAGIFLGSLNHKAFFRLAPRPGRCNFPHLAFSIP